MSSIAMLGANALESMLSNSTQSRFQKYKQEFQQLGQDLPVLRLPARLMVVYHPLRPWLSHPVARVGLHCLDHGEFLWTTSPLGHGAILLG